MKKKNYPCATLLLAIALFFTISAVPQTSYAGGDSALKTEKRVVDEKWVKANYTKTEHLVPMRDSIGLYTIVYAPNDTLRHPILMTRSTYGIGPYGKEYNYELWDKNLAPFLESGYIIVYQDVRGQHMSEGDFENVRPVHILSDKGTNDLTDVYDTADWLLANTRSNGNIGLEGVSYLGFTSFTAALAGHPAIKAVAPQAPVTDWFVGDDFHSHGALNVSHVFGFMSYFGRPRPKPQAYASRDARYYTDDDYSFYLRNRALPKLTEMLGDSIAFWTDMAAHPNLDKFWKDRNPLNHMGNVKPAVFVIGGYFDAEDLYGITQTYKRLVKESPSTDTYFLFGPWSHGGWRWDASRLGALRFGSDPGDKVCEMKVAFFDHYLRGVGGFDVQKVTVYKGGENKWTSMDQWPPKDMVEKPVYLADGGKISFSAPTEKNASTSYHSDPAKPVPYRAEVAQGWNGAYMYDDQRFASQHPDVITFVSDPLDSAVTLAGPIESDIWMSSTTTDADLIVKLIDVYPDDFSYPREWKPERYPMGGYQQMVRFDIMPAHFREGMDKRVALKPGKPTRIKMEMCDVSHTFLPGHRIMVQIQSSMFPLFRMSPQQNVNEYQAKDSDFVPADITVYHSEKYPSKLLLPVVGK